MAILYRTIGNFGVRPLLRAAYRAEVRGGERVPSEGPCILVANHDSVADPFVLGLATRRTVRYMAKAELFRNGLLRSLLEGLGTFPVERGRGDRDAMARARNLLAAGEVLGIFPQGTCLPSSERRWRRGAARLALETGAPLVPVGLVGTEKALGRGGLRIGFPRLRVLIGRPIEVERTRPTIVGAQALIDRAEAAILELRRPYLRPRAPLARKP